MTDTSFQRLQPEEWDDDDDDDDYDDGAIMIRTEGYAVCGIIG
jgi:hypothetical protein